jgi:hypothetical protein
MTVVTELNPVDQTLLRHIYQLRLLTTRQAIEITGLLPRTTRKVLRRLADAGLLAEVIGPPPGRERRWLCSELGRSTAEATREVNPRSYQMNESVARSAAHLIGINDVGIALTQWAGHYDDQVTWEPEVAHPYGKTNAVIADASLCYTLHSDAGDIIPLWRFVEYDRGTEAIHRLVAKLRAYVEVAGYRPPQVEGELHRPAVGWQRHYPTFPHILFVFGDMTEEAAASRISLLAGAVGADQFLAEHANTITTWATTLHRLQTQNPFQDDIIVRIPHGEARPLHTRR